MKIKTKRTWKCVLSFVMALCMMLDMTPLSYALEEEKISQSDEVVVVSGEEEGVSQAKNNNLIQNFESVGEAQQNLTLDKATKIAKAYKEQHTDLTNLPLAEVEGGIHVYNGEGLILLSYVNPQEYQSKKITLMIQGASGWDLLQPVRVEAATIDNETIESGDYVFQGLGNSEFPFKGEFIRYDENSIQTKRALFHEITSAAVIKNSLTFSVSQKTYTNQPLFAEKVSAANSESSSQNLAVQLSLNISEDTTETSVCLGGMIGIIDEGASVSETLTVSGKQDVTITVTGEGDVGLFCCNMKPGASLQVKYVGNEMPVEVKAPNAVVARLSIPFRTAYCTEKHTVTCKTALYCFFRKRQSCGRYSRGIYK